MFIGTEIDINRCAHILVAGQTGSGKSVCMNAIICALIQEEPNAEMVFIDLKRVELLPYKYTRQCVAYETTEAGALVALRYAEAAMEARFECMEEERLKLFTGEHLFIFIDEFADLALESREFRRLVAKIARLGRAARVHLIAATQHPTKQVIDTQIKYNMPTKICFRTSRVGSMVVLDHPGAEKLSDAGAGIIQRSDGTEEFFKGVMVRDKEIYELVDRNGGRNPARDLYESFKVIYME